MTAPKYVIFVLLDEPKGDAKSKGYATAGWTAAPLAGRVIKRIAPLLGVQPVDDAAPPIKRAMAQPLYSRQRNSAVN